MDRVRYMVTFARVVESGSFVGAADKLNMAPPVVSKHIAKLEKEVGARLLNRSTRSLSLTEAGTAFYEHCARIVEELEASEQAVASLQAEPVGHLRISTTLAMINALLVPMLPGFMQAYPGIKLDLVSNDRIVDLVEEGYDMALRITSEPAPQLVARPLTPVSFHVMGSPRYFQQHGVPQTLEDLSRHVCLNYPAPIAEKWAFIDGNKRVEVEVDSPVRINSVDALKALVLQGLGLAMMPVYAAVPELSSGQLKVCLPHYKGFGEATLYAVHLQHRYGSPKIRAFVDYLSAHIKQLQFENFTTPGQP